MELIKDLGKKKDSKGRKRRYGLFSCDSCNREVERRIDCGSTQKNCGCLTHGKDFRNFETWVCTTCNTEKPLKDYYKRTDTHSYRRECKTCVIEKSLIRNYGVDYTWYDKKLKEQKDTCAICTNTLEHRNNTKFCIDHNHTTGKVRGLLCSNCNTALGLLKDNTSNLNNAIQYLNKYKEDIV